MSTDPLRTQLEHALGTQYKVESELTGGGMSRVFVATETALGRSVVVKVLPTEMAGQLAIERFRREISLAAQLQHAHIVPLLTAGDAGGVPYFTMPFIRGESLRSQLVRLGEFPVNEAVRMLREIASALAFAHDAGIVHRDIKPDNVLLSGGAAMVTDFGVAKALSASSHVGDGITSVGMALGTPAYMSPEQATASPIVDHRADIYAWGVLAYELLTGSTPFAGRPPQAQLAAHVTEAPDVVTRRREAISPALATLIMRCLEKRAADRPQSAHEIVRSLDALSTPNDGTRPFDVTSTNQSDSRRVDLRKASIVGGIVILGIAGVVAFVQRQRSSTAVAPTSVAVLPFEIAAGDTAIEYLSEGISDGLRGSLLDAGVRVAARASSAAFKGKSLDVSAITKTLSVATVLTGHVKHLGNRLTVSVELSNAEGFQLWQRSVDTQTNDALAAQNQILTELAGALRARLVPASSDKARHRKTDAVTYDLFMRAKHSREQGTKAALERAVDFLNQAIARDSMYAPAYDELAYTYLNQADAFLPPREVLPRAMAAMQRALVLDDSLSTAHWELAAAREEYYYDWTGASAGFDRAIALDSNDAGAHFWRAAHYMAIGEKEKSLKDLRLALELDPLSATMNHLAVAMYIAAGLPDSAIARYQRAIEIAPDFIYGECWVAIAYRTTGQLQEALRLEREATKKLGRPTAGLVRTLALLGQRDEARKLLLELEKRSARVGGEYYPAEFIAQGLLALGDKSRAMDFLEKGVDEQSGAVTFIAWFHDDFKPLYGEPRWTKYLERVHLTPYFK